MLFLLLFFSLSLHAKTYQNINFEELIHTLHTETSSSDSFLPSFKKFLKGNAQSEDVKFLLENNPPFFLISFKREMRQSLHAFLIETPEGFKKYCESFPRLKHPLNQSLLTLRKKYCSQKFFTLYPKLSYFIKNLKIFLAYHPKSSYKFIQKNRKNSALRKSLYHYYHQKKKVLPTRFIKVFPNYKKSSHFKNHQRKVAKNKSYAKDYQEKFSPLYEKTLLAITEKNLTPEVKKEILALIDLHKDLKSSFFKKSLTRLYTLYMALLRHQYFETSFILHHYLMKKKYPDVGRLHFRVLWAYSAANQYQLAHSYIKKYSILKNYGKKSSQIQFWTLYCLYQGNYKIDYSHYLDILNQKHPLSFYALFSPHFFKKIKYQYSFKESFPFNQTLENIKLSESFWRLLFRLNFYANNLDNLFQKEVNYFLKNKTHEIHLKSFLNKKNLLRIVLASFAQKNKFYLLSFILINKMIDHSPDLFSQKILRYIYPTHLAEYFQFLENTSLKPQIVLSLIRQESAFNPKATSHAGARGLMQIMPATGRTLKRGLKKEELYNPQVNLELGTRYLLQLLKNYNNNLMYSLCAYNAGERRVSEWQEKKYFPQKDLLHNIESIPFKETRKYVKFILRNYYFYSFLLNGFSKPVFNLLESDMVLE